jgi:hypothetical protein
MRQCILSFWNNTNSSNSSYTADKDCFLQAVSVYFDTENSFLKDCDCPFECQLSEYCFESSMSDFPTLNYYQNNYVNNSVIRSKLGDQVSFERVRKSVASVRIYYNHFRETVVVDSIKLKPFDLLSSIGGILGLFLGFSCVVLVDLFEIALQSFILMIKNNSIRSWPKNNQISAE